MANSVTSLKDTNDIRATLLANRDPVSNGCQRCTCRKPNATCEVDSSRPGQSVICRWKMVQKSVLVRSSQLRFFRSVPQIQNDVGNCIICPISGNEISETPSSSYGTRFKGSQFKLQMDI